MNWLWKHYFNIFTNLPSGKARNNLIFGCSAYIKVMGKQTDWKHLNILITSTYYPCLLDCTTLIPIPCS